MWQVAAAGKVPLPAWQVVTFPAWHSALAKCALSGVAYCRHSPIASLGILSVSVLSPCFLSPATQCIDYASQPLPKGYDLVFSRDSLQHIPLHGTWQYLNNVRASGAKYLLVGSYIKNPWPNQNVPGGEGWLGWEWEAVRGGGVADGACCCCCCNGRRNAGGGAAVADWA